MIYVNNTDDNPTSGKLLVRVYKAAERAAMQNASCQPIGHGAMVELRAAVNAVRKERGLKPITTKYARVARDPGRIEKEPRRSRSETVGAALTSQAPGPLPEKNLSQGAPANDGTDHA